MKIIQFLKIHYSGEGGKRLYLSEIKEMPAVYIHQVQKGAHLYEAAQHYFQRNVG